MKFPPLQDLGIYEAPITLGSPNGQTDIVLPPRGKWSFM